MSQRVTARVECHHVRSARATGGQHGQHGHRSVNPLAVDEIPPTPLSDHAGDARCKVVVPVASATPEPAAR